MQTAPSSQPAPVQAESTFQFINSIGVDTHNNDGDDTYATLAGQFVSEFQYLGVNLAGGALDAVGLSGGGLAYLQKVESDMAHGIRYDFAIGGGSTPMPIATVIADLNLLEIANPGMIAFVTGQNEVGEGDPNINADIAAAQNYQNQLYAAIKADPLLSSVGDITYSIGSMDPKEYTTLGNQSSNTGYGNVHAYSSYFPPQIYDSYYLPVNNSGTPNDPFVVTETGYPDNPWPGAGMSDDVVAKYQLDNIFDMLLDGASAVEVYELLDQGNDPYDTRGSENHFGFFTWDGQPKESATALHNLTTILHDPGSNAGSFQAGTLSYSVSGLASALNPAAAQAAFGYGIFTTYVASQPIYGASYLLEKSNGTFDIAVWQEPEIWDNNTAQAIPDSASPVTITLAQTAQSVEVYDPLVGTAPIATYSDVSSVTVMVSDHPLIVEVDPFAPGTTAPSTSPAPVTVGSGPNTLTLFVSESGQPGGSQFTVTVDGLQIGGVQTTSANSAAGQAQQFNFLGSFAQGANSIVVSYLNASNSLFSVDSVDINGTYVPGSYSVLSNNGVISSTFTQTTGPAAVAIGSGPNTLDLFVSESGAPAGAQFTISVDGQQIGGVQTTTADAASGQVQQFDVSGTFSAGNNPVTINYLNASNSVLHVNSATINGVGIAASTLALSNNGYGDLSFSQSSGGPGPVTLGSGPDVLAVFMSDRGQPGAANFTISVDGQQVGGVQSTTADYSRGQSQQFDVLGNFGAGNHTVAVNYLNAANSLLIVDGVTINQTAVANSFLVLNNNGSTGTTFTKPGTPVPLAIVAPVPVAPIVVAPPAPVVSSTPTVASAPTAPSTPVVTSTPSNSTGTVVIGSGSDTLALTMSERAATNGAQFTVSVDGQQIGGVQTTSANSLAGQTQTFNVEGTFAAGSHVVSVNYLNANNSLLYVNGTTIDGAAVANGSLTLSNNGSAGIGFTKAGGSSTMVLGSGSDTLALSVSERAADYGAQFTISVDGQQVGGVQATSASTLAGQSQVFDVLGNFGAGSHTVSVAYLNANNSLLVVNGATIDGNGIGGSGAVLSNNYSVGFGFAEPGSPTAGATVVGSGPDSLDLFMSQRAAPAGAQFTVSVDGQQIGGVQAVTANVLAGQEQQFDMLGNFAPGNHTVSVNYLNANNSLMFVNTATINGATISGSGLVGSNNGPLGFSFATPSAPPPTTIGSGPDTLALSLSQDYYLGNAQFTVSVDGQQIGGTQTASAITGNGQSQMLDVLGNFSGAHTVSLNFLNDASTNQPGPGTDRNLHLGGATIDGVNIANSSLNLYNTGAKSFTFSH